MDAISSLYTDQEKTALNVQTPGGEMGKNEFMKMLVTQMQNQDPLKPMSNSEMTAQLAQFSALEQMEDLNKKFESYQQNSTAAFSLMSAGKKVEVEFGDGSDPVKGVLEKIQWENGEPNYVIEGKAYSISDILSMKMVPDNTNETPEAATEVSSEEVVGT